MTKFLFHPQQNHATHTTKQTQTHISEQGATEDLKRNNQNTPELLKKYYLFK